MKKFVLLRDYFSDLGWVFFFEKYKVNSSQEMTVFNNLAVNKGRKGKGKLCRQSWKFILVGLLLNVSLATSEMNYY